MENNNIFAGMPVLTLITNFSETGNFERIHMVMERKISSSNQNQIKRKSIPNTHRFWNGPDFNQTIERN